MVEIFLMSVMKEGDDLEVVGMDVANVGTRLVEDGPRLSVIDRILDC